MTDDPNRHDEHSSRPHSAEVELSLNPPRFTVRVQTTPSGLLAIGGLVSSILLSTGVLVWVSTSVARRHPLAAGILPR